MKKISLMKRTRNILGHPFGLILPLAVLMSLVTLEPIALAQVNSNWTFTGSLNTPRSGHTATLLPNGMVLVAGGWGFSGLHNTAELYDPAAGAWSVTGGLNTPRDLHTATLLPNGKVLVAGGTTTTTPPDFGLNNSAELYDPATGTLR